MGLNNRRIAALTGAYIADAAALGTHWLYDQERMAALPGGGAWLPPDQAHFTGAKGIFVHHGKQLGDISHYGAQMRVMVRALEGGAFDLAAYQKAFAATFGPGGAWRGYIDKATKGTLANLVAEASPSGADDDQIPALGGTPPLAAIGATAETTANAVAAVSASATTAQYAPAASAALSAIMAGADIRAALEAGVEAAGEAVKAPLRDAIDAAGASSEDYAQKVGLACPLPQSLPLAFQIAAGASGFEDAVRRNIRAAGDTCGRAIFLGAFCGAADAPPAAWAMRLREGPTLIDEIERMGVDE